MDYPLDLQLMDASSLAYSAFFVQVRTFRTEYHLHKSLLASKSCTLLHYCYIHSLALNMTEKVDLSDTADSEDAFQVFVEFLYLSDYSPPTDMWLRDGMYPPL
jgi:hypothetical protein